MTKALYHEDAYIKSFSASITHVGEQGIVLDQSAFYPGGGGQPCDQGHLRVANVDLPVTRVRRQEGLVWHQVEGDAPNEGDQVEGFLDWERRYQLMRVHTAMHILCGVIWRDYGASVTGGNMEPLRGRMDFEFESMRKELVLTQPDNTQYQVMRVAVKRGWHHIRVLNLSDLRDPKSGSFLQKVDALSQIMGGHVHSIFCAERSAERRQALKRRERAPVLLGWGQDAGLLPLAEQCMKRLEGEPVSSVPSDVHPLLNAHPSPMLQSKKLLWLNTIMKELDG